MAASKTPFEDAARRLAKSKNLTLEELLYSFVLAKASDHWVPDGEAAMLPQDAA